MNIYLIGMMGVGKTTIGKKLSQSFNKKVIDVDQKIELDTQEKISQIFSKYGEKYFRDLETQTLKVLSNENDLIISCGGGVILNPENIDVMHKTGKIILIKRDLEKVLSSIDASTRPLLKTPDAYVQIYEKRKLIYETSADYIIENNSTIDSVIEKIKSKLFN